MAALRIHSLPIGLTVFTALYVIANKAPATVETTNIVVWILLPVALAWKISRRRR
jgi:hypothetical protein